MLELSARGGRESPIVRSCQFVRDSSDTIEQAVLSVVLPDGSESCYLDVEDCIAEAVDCNRLRSGSHTMLLGVDIPTTILESAPNRAALSGQSSGGSNPLEAFGTRQRPSSRTVQDNLRNVSMARQSTPDSQTQP